MPQLLQLKARGTVVYRFVFILFKKVNFSRYQLHFYSCLFSRLSTQTRVQRLVGKLDWHRSKFSCLHLVSYPQLSSFLYMYSKGQSLVDLIFFITAENWRQVTFLHITFGFGFCILNFRPARIRICTYRSGSVPDQIRLCFQIQTVSDIFDMKILNFIIFTNLFFKPFSIRPLITYIPYFLRKAFNPSRIRVGNKSFQICNNGKNARIDTKIAKIIPWFYVQEKSFG